MVDLATAANIAEIVGAITIIGAIGFAIFQLRAFERQRETMALGALFQASMMTPDFVKALDTVLRLPERATADEVNAGGESVSEAASRVYVTFETIGMMVFLRMVHLEEVNKILREPIVRSWMRLEGWLRGKREVSRTKTRGEWFQWLAERLEATPSQGLEAGAFEAFRSWRP